ncbi:hypothetical protein GN241_13265 [Rhodobacteraceae bacterium IMCC1335]
MPSISKETYVTRNFQKISGKRWELYVITRVIHLLNDPDIEYVCQQYIKPPKNEGHYLADLAFPSLRLYLEIDEGQHGNQDHKLSDIKRDAEILEATDWQCQRIAIFVEQGNTKVDKKLEVLNKEIDDFVQYIRNRKQNLISQGNSISWNYEEKYLPETFIKQQIINVKDNVALLNHRDVLRLFGYTKGHYQRAVWTIDNFHEIVWFPKLYPNADWVNEFNEETGSILQFRKDKTPHPMPAEDDPERIVFAHQKNTFGQTLYKFYGVYAPDISMSDPVNHYFKRIKTSIDLKKYF